MELVKARLNSSGVLIESCEPDEHAPTTGAVINAENRAPRSARARTSRTLPTESKFCMWLKLSRRSRCQAETVQAGRCRSAHRRDHCGKHTLSQLCDLESYPREIVPAGRSARRPPAPDPARELRQRRPRRARSSCRPSADHRTSHTNLPREFHAGASPRTVRRRCGCAGSQGEQLPLRLVERLDDSDVRCELDRALGQLHDIANHVGGAANAALSTALSETRPRLNHAVLGPIGTSQGSRVGASDSHAAYERKARRKLEPSDAPSWIGKR